MKEEKTNFTSSETTEEVETTQGSDVTAQNDPEELGEVAPNEEYGDTTDSSQQLPPNVEKIKGRWWLPYVITFGVLAVFTLLVGWARGGFSPSDTKSLLSNWCDAFFVPGILAVSFGLLVVASNGGAFDMLAYGMKRLFAFFKKDPIDRKYGGFYEYQQARREKKRSFWYLLIMGGAYFLVSIILLVIYYQV